MLFECIDILIDAPRPRSALAEESIDVGTECRRNIFFVSFLAISSSDVRSTEKTNAATNFFHESRVFVCYLITGVVQTRRVLLS